MAQQRYEGSQQFEEFLGAIRSLGLIRNQGNFRYYLQWFFGRRTLEGLRVLDIGGGDGLLSFAAAAMGAREVVCVEPQGAGSESGILSRFDRIQTETGLDRVILVPKTFQQAVEAITGSFDLVISKNSINHLNEPACVSLLMEPGAWQEYVGLARQIYSVTRPGGEVMVADCSRRNVFRDLGVSNPFDRHIEWEKHHTPCTWRRVFVEGGFRYIRTTYPSFNSLRWAGRVVCGNPLFHYLYASNFMMRFGRDG